MLCDDLKEWNAGAKGRVRREGIYVYIELIYIVVQQKLTQHSKAILLQLATKLKERRADV